MKSSEREISPLHLLLYLGNWHLIAYCHSRGDLRDFVLSRVTEMEILADPVSEELLARDIKGMIDRHYGIFLQGEEKQVRVRFRGRSVGIVRDQLWFAGQQVDRGKRFAAAQLPGHRLPRGARRHPALRRRCRGAGTGRTPGFDQGNRREHGPPLWRPFAQKNKK